MSVVRVLPGIKDKSFTVNQVAVLHLAPCPECHTRGGWFRLEELAPPNERDANAKGNAFKSR